MDAAQWPHQGIGGLVKGVESSERRPQIQQVERRARPQKEQALNCPRCDSTNTKFCYYNNYSLTQPRYFCKTCRRYWTEGGTLRNVPVGGGSRKNKRSSSSSSSSFSPSPSSTPTAPTKTTTTTTPQPSRELDHLAYKFYREAHDLNLSFQNRSLVAGHDFGGAPLSALDLLRSGGISTAALGGSFVPVQMPPPPGSLFGPGFGFPELVRPASSINIGSIQLTNESHEVQAQGDTTLFWNGVMGGSGNRGAAGSW